MEADSSEGHPVITKDNRIYYNIQLKINHHVNIRYMEQSEEIFNDKEDFEGGYICSIMELDKNLYYVLHPSG